VFSYLLLFFFCFSLCVFLSFSLSFYFFSFTIHFLKFFQVTFEALEDAGLSLRDIAGSRTAVVVGGFTLDHMLFAAENRPHTNSHTAFGITMTTLSSRLAHTFDLRGPCLTVGMPHCCYGLAEEGGRVKRERRRGVTCSFSS
jgi:hypothetical protein